MNKLSWFTKNKMLIISSIGLIILFIGYNFNLSIPVDVCGGGFCGDISEFIRVYFLIFIPVLFFSLLTYSLKEATFVTWRNFSIWAIVIIIIIICILPVHKLGNYLAITKEMAAFYLTKLYSIISIILITYKSLKKDSTQPTVQK